MFADNLRLIDETIRMVCRKGGCTPDEREDFTSESHLRLIENDYAILRKYEGRCSLRTYLAAVLANQLFDFRRHRWGTWRPSAKARQQGAAAEALDRLIHRDRIPLEEAIERLASSGRFPEGRDALRRLAESLPPHYPRVVQGDDGLQDLAAAPCADADRELQTRERAATARSVQAALAGAMEELAEEDRLVLRLRFQDGVKVPRIAHVLGLDAKALYRRCDRLLETLREILERRGVSGASVLECLGEDSWPDDGGGPEGGH